MAWNGSISACMFAPRFETEPAGQATCPAPAQRIQVAYPIRWPDGNRRGDRGATGAYWALESFIITSPETISTAAATRMALICSPRTATPTTKAPTAPIPVQIV